MLGDGIEDNEADGSVTPGQVVDAGPGGETPGAGVQLAHQPLGMARGDGVEAKVAGGQ